MDCPENITIKIEDSEEPVDNGTGVGDWNPFIQFEGKHEPISNSENCPVINDIDNTGGIQYGCISEEPSTAQSYNIQDGIYNCNKCIFKSNSEQTMFQHFLSSHIVQIDLFNNITNDEHPIIVRKEDKFPLTVEDIKPQLMNCSINLSDTLDIPNTLQKAATEHIDVVNSTKKKSPAKQSANTVHALSYRSETSTYVCNHCSYITTSSSKALEHLKQDHNHINYQCYCKKYSSDSKIELEVHLNTHIKYYDTTKSARDKKKYRCCICEFAVNIRNILQNHYFLKHIRKLFFCITCSLEFFSMKFLEDHITNVHNKNNEYCCLHCGYFCNTHNMFLDHVKLHRSDPSKEHSNNSNQTISNNLGSSVYKCLHCTFSTLDIHNFTSHLQIHKNLPSTGTLLMNTSHIENTNNLPEATVDLEDTYKCNFCTFTSFLKKNIKDHVIKTHSDKQKYYFCDLCGKYFSTINIKKIHIKMVHTENKMFNCMHCKFSTKYLSSLKDHKKGHMSEKPQLCYICGHRTIHQASMDKHIARHFKIKRFACDMCEFKTVSKCKLCDHQKRHTKERPYQCDECPHRSKTKYELKMHKGIHVIDKQISCSICHFKCNENFQLTMHMKKHFVQNRIYYNCKMCPKKYATKANLKLHELVHLGIQYNCRFCNFTTNTKLSLNNHEARHSEESRMHCFYCDYSSTHRANFTEHVNKTCAKAKHRKEDLRCCYYCKYSSSHRSNFTKHVNGGCNELKKILKMKKKSR